MTRHRFILAAACLVAPLQAQLVVPANAADWPQWRGPELRGTSPEKSLPVKWSLTEGIAWKLAMPTGSGATPIVSGDRIYLNVADGDTVSLWCLDRKTSAVVWKKPLGPSAGHAHKKHNMSTPSPVTDGKRVFAMTGQGALKGFDASGKELWARDIQKDYGAFGTNWGYGSSPLLFEDLLYVPVLHGMKTDEPSYLLGIEPATGKTRFKVERPTKAHTESPDAYTTPTVARRGKEVEIVVSGGDIVTGHDPKTGAERWRVDGLNPESNPYYRIIASPVAAGDVVVAPTRVKPMLVLKAFGSGDVTKSAVLWSYDRGPDVPTPATDGTLLYVLTDKGLLSCMDLATGKLHYGPERLKMGTYSSSPLLADGKLYITSEEAVTSVVKAGTTFEVLAENVLDGFTVASPAAASGQIFIRTGSHLFAIGGPAAGDR
jgi:outer membrane protein assembly factor BamB